MAIRPYRIWDSRTKTNLPHRCYSTEIAALDRALILIRWSHVGTTYEIYDLRGARWVGTYARRVNSITFERKNNGKVDS